MNIQGVDGSLVPLKQDLKGKQAFQEIQSPNLPETKSKKTDQNEESSINQQNQKKQEEDLGKAVEQANETMETYGTELRFSIHKGSGEVMVKVINAKDNSVVREIPPERILDMVASVKKMLGIIIDKFI